MFKYSDKKNNAKTKPEYSTLYPLTSYDSVSAISNGILFNSAKNDTKKIIPTIGIVQNNCFPNIDYI